ncbi:putative RNA methyltransferase [Actinoalloteichus hymeniacidonis]|uniref:23S rRNA m(1)G-748 methyltransferase n=1 Tax=Actinoalloteichus hymeniacidonis TaxID=340345 RepID=A0AAC9HPT3_9PSEU|nr:methyltransferase domain-containing protein [Actinoalloteichus hymeniacidonis]AOS63244.1 23S rRNA m(1)G-748 methyltransferase [Actinoalloteichus hymeniacidonis]MBB5908717.1 SAM-dependent methyltransferase [Actinoalloteichus hymeniacidonis]
MTLDQAVPFLCCPHCGHELHRVAGSLHCPERHVFDVAKQGYVSLLPGAARPQAADTAEMVAARSDFLGGGHLDPISEALRSLVAAAVDDVPGCVLDVGAGTGRHLGRVLDAVPERVGIALDLSKPALRRAVRAHSRMAAVCCDVWRGLPVRTGSAAAVVNIFAPRNGPELRRVLAPAGRLFIVTPTRGHLSELIQELDLLTVAADKHSRLADTLGPGLALDERHTTTWHRELDHSQVRAVVGMGPNAWHQDPAELDRKVARLPARVTVRFSVDVSRYRPAPS